jgi:dTDP-4-dehydrorhamnose reductase
MSKMSRIEPIRSGNQGTHEPLEIWAGVECTCNRVGDRYFDQMEFSGHAAREGDFEKIAELGIKRLRFGTLWERYTTHGSWAWTDRALRAVQAAGMRPIAGLMHHGSGPMHTSLLDPEFPEQLAQYAEQVAARYPWIDSYTPVNEPNTTARFSGQYGVWYPHERSRRCYLRALLNQVKATVLSMEAIRRVRPDAQLVQTDDLGSVSGTEHLRPVWEMLNLRQWLPFDLLSGAVDRHHPMFGYMRAEGIPEREILWFLDHPCPPDVVGINYYVTSDRYIDERIGLYSPDLISSEGPFVDVEAVRVREAGIRGFGAVLAEAWDRYRIPVAVTEVHLGCDPDEQIRWLVNAWRDATDARQGGVDCVGLTVWALLGSFYWNQLVTRENGHYEPGVFDLRSGQPQPTELAAVVRDLTRGQAPCHPALSGRGWWEHDSRICFPSVEAEEEEVAA